MSMSEPEWPYAGRYAALYDLFYSDKPYSEEAAFVHARILEFSPKPAPNILELACGTGRHAHELEKFGYNVTAADRSSDMLQIARDRAAGNDSRIQFVEADMRRLDLPKKDFDVAVCLFDSIGYLKTNDAIAAALIAIRNHLRSGGLFIFEFWHAPPMLNDYSPSRVRRWKIDATEVVRTSKTTLDPENRLATVDYTVEERRRDGVCTSFHERHVNRFFSVEEMRTFLCHANLEPVKFFAGFNDAVPITDQTWHIIAVARKT